MPCEHLRELFELCEKHELQIASRDAIRVVCRQCEEQEVCPSSLTDGEQVLKVPDDHSSDNSDENSSRQQDRADT